MAGWFDWFPGGESGAGMGGALGLSALNDWFAARSARNAEAERRKAYDLLLNPSALSSSMAAARQPLSAETMTQINRGLNSNLALRGISEPGSGVGNQYVADAYAKILPSLQSQQDANYLTALTGAGRFAPQRYGQGGTLNETLKWLMIANAMKPKPQQTPQVADTSYFSGYPAVNMPGENIYSGMFNAEDQY